MPSENELIKTYNVSNTTARKALLDIEIRGWASRIKGKGTFVLNRSKDMHLTRILGSFDAMKESFGDNLVKEGFTPRNIMLEKTIFENGISTNVNGRNYTIEGPVLKVHRLRYANYTLMKDETKYISMTICKNIHLKEIEQSLIKIYEDDYGLKLEDIRRGISATILCPDMVDNYFGNEIPLAAFILNSACLVAGSKVVEIEYSYYRGDKYRSWINTKPQLIPQHSK